ncbi:hypothetical protein [Histidinibacterium aquaticum]|uniref:Uncharacterized protein n=1 Tax=Histidinibacterium aquaticum TaxID=2613962 RepID=A0A5J5GGY5_9RHOB|nr:hypothetical protein [Histidinibacterium aquaticum]KAA9007003.1 hypothetical protein F3S47_14660 [Histidinibacterium aquaticum]
MSWPVLLFFLLQGVVFLVWAALAFRTLFHLRTRAVQRTGRIFPGPASFFSTMSDWVRDPQQAESRRMLLSATVLMALLSLVSAFA